ncbi:MAG: hypothetical protein WAK33_14720, partial [Silvibacterium sp.]
MVTLAIVGIFIGAAAAATAIHLVQGMFYGVTAYGAMELSVAAAALLIVAIFAAGRPPRISRRIHRSPPGSPQRMNRWPLV